MSFYFSLGSQNEDTRGLALDAEANVIVSGFHAAAGLVDFYEIMARSTWVSTPADLEPYLPHDSSLMGRLARFIRVAM
jgi:phosphatidylserine/phosphatidylglycerophosphate/cardiolipin synthase-like enzyme